MHRRGVNIDTAATAPLSCVETCDTNAPRSSETTVAKLLHYASPVRVPSSKRRINLREDPDNIRCRDVPHRLSVDGPPREFFVAFRATPVVDVDDSFPVPLRSKKSPNQIIRARRLSLIPFAARAVCEEVKIGLCGKSEASEREEI